MDRCDQKLTKLRISVKTKHCVRRVMEILKHGCFFFFLSKLLAVDCLSTNPPGPANLGGQNGMSQWSGQQPVTNGYNSFNYNAPQGVYSNGVYPNNYPNGQQSTMPRAPQSYNFQEQQYSPTIQPNPVMQNKFGESQPQNGQSNLNNDYHNQPTKTQYPNYNNVNIDHDQPNYQEYQSGLQTQGVNSQPQPYQFQPQALPTSLLQQSTSQLKPTVQNPQQPINSPFPQQFKIPETQSESNKPSPITSQFPPQDMSSSNQPQLQTLPTSLLQQSTSQLKPTMQNPQQPQQSTNSPFPQQFKIPETQSESNKPSQFPPQENSSSNQSQPQTLPASLSPQFTSQSKPTIQNTLQPQQSTNSPFLQQFKTPETQSESNNPSTITSRFPPQDMSSSNQSQLETLPALLSQQLTPQSKPTMQNTLLPQQSTNSPFPQQFKTPETQSESNKPSQFPPQENSSSNQSQPQTLSMSSSPQQPTLKSKPNMQSYPTLQQLTDLSFQSQLKNAEEQSETNIPSQMKPQPSQSNSFPYQSQSLPNPMSPPLQPFPLHPIPTMQNAPQSPQPTKSSPSPQFKTPETQSTVNIPSKITPQSSSSQIQSQTLPTSFSPQQYTAQSKPFTQNPSQVPQPTKSSPLQNSNVPVVFPGSENTSQNDPNSPVTFNFPFKYIPNHLEPFQTLPGSAGSTINLNNNVMQDQDFQILDSQLNKPNELNDENEMISSLDNSDGNPTNDANSNDNSPNNILNNNQFPRPEDEVSNLESKLENAALQRPTDLFDDTTDTSVFKEKIPLISPNSLIFNDPSTSTGLSMYDTPNPVDIEDPKNAEELNVKYRVYADPNDIHIINTDPIKSSSSFSGKIDMNNINLINSQPTRPSWSFPPWSNNFEDQKSSFNSDQLLSSSYNNNENPMFYNQMYTGTSNNNYDNQFNTYSSANQNQKISNTPSDVPTNANQPSSTDVSGYIYKQIDFNNPPSSISSWSLTKNDYLKNQRSDQKNGIPRTNTLETPSRYNQNDNQYISNPSSNYNKSIQNMITAIANAVQAPLDGTSKIFDITQASFPNTDVIQQLNLTYSVVKSIILSLRKILNTVVNNLFGRRAKRDFNMFGPMSSLSPKTAADPVHLQFPTIGNLKKKNYQQSNSAGPFESNANAYYENRPTATAPPPTVGNFKDQLYSRRRQQMYGDDQIDDMEDIDIDDERPSQRSALNVRVARQSPNTQKYAIDILGNEIQTAIYLNLPDSYSSDSPEVKEYTQKIIWAVEMIFRGQINNVIQGNSPNMNII